MPEPLVNQNKRGYKKPRESLSEEHEAAAGMRIG
jgi:hypothetical protein